MDFETEIRDLKRRVANLEGAVTLLSGQFSQIHPELAGFRSDTVKRLEATESEVHRLVERLDTINTQVWSLRDDMPVLLRDALDAWADKRHGDTV